MSAIGTCSPATMKRWPAAREMVMAATCISAASYFARQILNGGAKERDNYLNVLKAGGSDYPVDILKRAGLDMTSPAPYQAVIAVFKDTLDQVEALMA